MPTELASVIDRITVLLEDLEAGRYPGRTVVEETMTDGYAMALALDGECVRLERRISDLALELCEDRGTEHAVELSEHVVELSGLAGMLTRRRGELDELRGLLASLKSLGREEKVA